MTLLKTGTDDLLASLESGVLTLTLNRPQAKNAMTLAMLTALAEQLAQAETNNNVRCIVLTGAGDAFCAGGDVKAMARDGDGTVGTNTIDGAIHKQQMNQRATAGKLMSIGKPTLAVLPGAAAGAGLSLALACDLRLMSTRAIMTTSFARVGFSGDYGGAYLMTQLVGAAKAREFYYFSDRINAEEALRLGLANWICDPADLAERTKEIVTRLSTGPAIAFRYMKQNLNRALPANFEDCLDLEAVHHLHCGQTEDHREGATAFVERRAPIFVGR